MPTQLTSRRVAVVGLGTSGLSVVRFCIERGARVVACDDRNEAALAKALPAISPLLSTGRLELALGGLRSDVLCGVDLIVCSPGVPPTRQPLVDARNAGIPITGEIELASQYITAPIVGITGTNGKSTVTSLCGAIAKATSRPSFCGGNLGTPLTDAVGTAAGGPQGIVVIELSSYQLETCESLSCQAAAILNLTPDHLDRYPSMRQYGDAKARIFRNMAPWSTKVTSADDPEVQALYARHLGSNDPCFLFTTQSTLPSRRVQGRAIQIGGFVDGGDLVLRGAVGGLQAVLSGREPVEERYPLQEFQLVGRHNQANMLAAFLLMRASGLASYEQVRRAATTFSALPHRMQLVGESGGVAFFDDSKGTNVDAVVAGLAGFPRPLVLIAGGRDKGGSYEPLRKTLCEQTTRGVVVIGEAAPLIEQSLAGCPFPILHADSMQSAVGQAMSLCQSGDAVVLSPACSSFDMFRDYAHRAAVFCESVASLPGAKLSANHSRGGAHS
ncbi:MAG TPA: UDP-N-acetylmuramoyl-L-alanine--D-glutamate ligase [Pseudomonadota bacterium]|nr:UDP-N-acetylmuramoyl-L-alanine--D-glutamate ligase [Pseudomonadota bacterium]